MTVHTHIPTNTALNSERIYIRYRMDDWQESWPLHTHDGYEMYFFIQGIANYIIGDDIYQLQPGDMLLFKGEVLHRVNPSVEVPYVRSYVNFTADYLQDLLSGDMLHKLLQLFEKPSGLLIRWNETELAEVDAAFKGVYQEREKETFGYEFMMPSLLAQLLLRAYRKSKEMYGTFPAPALSQKEANVRRILLYLNQNFKEEVKLERLSAVMHLNKYYMCHCFKEITGFTINSYLARKRIDEAKKLLRTGDVPVGRLAEQLGFGGAVHFSRLFKQHVGVSPQMYRKMNQES
ncbi:helix-turn-helix domain-containing protein [Paenibacillus tyrfis]|uniref:helix-turn-helix domain-containing protein n=1 Tax=Paenibacillus tyrfis TaxID=1501230 RepID=UPI00209DD1A1|nr:helix-turn-helix domain-containing protein [Paenibacillus tyrfis]MCP1312477.1 helix-turn-helix domain-containing protein [Paenibacillus tyrfis]